MRLRENLWLNVIDEAALKIEEQALGRSTGHVSMTHPKGTGNAKIIGRSGGLSVPMTTLDNVWQRCGCEPIGFIKIDTEGWDSEIIDAGREAIATCRPNMLFEFNRARMKDLGFAVAPVWRCLTDDLQYWAFRIDRGGRLIPLSSPEHYENILFLHPRWSAKDTLNGVVVR